MTLTEIIKSRLQQLDDSNFEAIHTIAGYALTSGQQKRLGVESDPTELWDGPSFEIETELAIYEIEKSLDFAKCVAPSEIDLAICEVAMTRFVAWCVSKDWYWMCPKNCIEDVSVNLVNAPEFEINVDEDNLSA